MSTVQPLFSQRLRDAVEKKLNEEAFKHMPLLAMLKEKGRILFNTQSRENTHYVHPRMNGVGARTFDRLSTNTSTENEKSIELRYTHGQYFDEHPVSGLDEILNMGDDSQIFDNVAKVGEILMRRQAQDFYTELFAGDGTAKGPHGGQSIVGLNNILYAVPAGNTYATVPFTGNTDWWQHGTVSGATWIGNEYNRIVTTRESCTLRTDEGMAFKPDFAIANRKYINDLRELFFDKSNYQNPRPGMTARIGTNNDGIEVEGISIMPDDEVPAQTMYFLNSSSWELRSNFSELIRFDEKPSYNHTAPGTRVLQTTMVCVLKCLRPRLNAVLHSLPA